jgi:hypothetical protein
MGRDSLQHKVLVFGEYALASSNGVFLDGAQKMVQNCFSDRSKQLFAYLAFSSCGIRLASCLTE